ncbi:TetR/AcrR family transcriptional regulator [Kitasatospora viridis]|uniref:TetR family transcriptional regulator n=1 Tax=Kitasatospora viridis TaxID=281105 RepID=A0A561UGN4_9ACTN|nr:helix-turn-helix domain-containing protein [Kitasatospora viridis]TWF98513.1 TetR family transcriptional regulator [Kitasatospora viridis]
MMKQDHLLDPAVPGAGAATGPITCTVPEQRLPEQRQAEPEPAPAPAEERRSTRLRVDARRNLESVLRAAREVFGELGYDAPMEEVARRAGVGVGTVYRRFPSKEVLVQRIAAEEVAWLTARAREALYGSAGPWEALAGYLANAVGTGAGRLLPPEAFGYAEELARVPEQRPSSEEFGHAFGAGPGPVEPAPLPGGGATGPHADPRLLLQLLAALVARAASAGELRPGVTVSEIVLVLTAAVPPSIGRTVGPEGTDPGERLLQILLDGLRAA